MIDRSQTSPKKMEKHTPAPSIGTTISPQTTQTCKAAATGYWHAKQHYKQQGEEIRKASKRMKKFKHKLRPTRNELRDRVAKKWRSTKQGTKKIARSQGIKKDLYGRIDKGSSKGG